MYEVINGIVAAMILELVNKFSLLTYNTTLPGWERFTSLPIACARCVLPKPTPHK